MTAAAVRSVRRVVLCSNTSWYLYNFRLNLIKALRQQGYEVHSAAPRDDYTERLRSHVRFHYDLDFSSSSLNPFRELRLLWRFHRMLAAVGADVMLTFTAKPNIYGNLAASLRGVSVISNVAGLGSGFVGDSNVMEQVLKSLYRLAFSRAACLFFQNPDDHRLFTDLGIVKSERAFVIPGSGVDTARFSYHPVDSLPRVPFRFLFSGRMLRAKGVLEFLAAAREVEARVPGRAQFVLCGSPEVDNRDAVPRAILDAESSGACVSFAGHVDDVLPLIRSCHCAVLPSYYREGVPRCLLEAMAVGRPIITTDMPGCRETVNGRNGWLIDPRNVAALRDAMLAAMSLDAAALAGMGREARDFARSRFDESLVLKPYLEQVDRAFCGEPAAAALP